jgi:hypothetical protein
MCGKLRIEMNQNPDLSAFLQWTRDHGQWAALPAGGYKALLQAREALVGPVADGLSRRAAVKAIDAVLANASGEAAKHLST